MPAKSEIIDGRKRCSLCKEWLAVSEFAFNKQSATGFASWCRSCTKKKAEANRQARRADPAKVEADRDHKRKHKANLSEEVKRQRSRNETIRSYGVSPEWYEAKLVEQGGVCAICKLPESFTNKWSGGVKLLSIDHDHDNGEARGLLCQRCNVALGNMGDDPERVRNLARYLVERNWVQRG